MCEVWSPQVCGGCVREHRGFCEGAGSGTEQGAGIAERLRAGVLRDTAQTECAELR